MAETVIILPKIVPSGFATSKFCNVKVGLKTYAEPLYLTNR